MCTLTFLDPDHAAAGIATPDAPLRSPRSDLTDVEERVAANLPLVGHLVRKTLSRVPGHVSHDDLTSAGMLALVQAAKAYDGERGASFATYASLRIRGAEERQKRGNPFPVHPWFQRLSATAGRPSGISLANHWQRHE